MVSNGEKSKINEFSPVHVDGSTTFWCFVGTDIFFLNTLPAVELMKIDFFLLFAYTQITSVNELLEANHFQFAKRTQFDGKYVVEVHNINLV